MKAGIVGLGKMGKNLALNMMDNGHDVVAYNRTPKKVKNIEEKGAEGAYSLEGLVEKLSPPRVIWVMVPAGDPVHDIITRLSSLLKTGDVIVDGGNSHFKKTLERDQMLGDKGIELVDAGTSGGVTGARHGACMMVGASEDIYEYLEPLIDDITVEDGCIHTGTTGSGHFVKMVHNGIEYGMLEAIGEGFEVLEASDFDLNFEDIARVWNNGSVIESWLIELTKNVFEDRGNLEDIKPVIDSSGEGKWTVEEAIDLGLSVPVLAEALMVRYSTQQDENFGAKLIAALRNQFGGHDVENK
ncbi:phosphogluconate dehydrogenase (NAD(+)-dependent, decarboxylating) [Halarsenatibacter silvermanii]|uniref:6-phosphogluconate dehydrogenase n=1 Tax=Halarsenatibacter silvermanii TaxID=321763 RepID=A0A1G9J3I2_9FIRM|nr:decarboxylating 6-phosphogluconate dehydrogenase [Halarsenatibacter silvermanii]SDL31734.1 6-phosphogluconate dehydrogenase [Halarsenatibacter silvermanii]